MGQAEPIIEISSRRLSRAVSSRAAALLNNLFKGAVLVVVSSELWATLYKHNDEKIKRSTNHRAKCSSEMLRNNEVRLLNQFNKYCWRS